MARRNAALARRQEATDLRYAIDYLTQQAHRGGFVRTAQFLAAAGEVLNDDTNRPDGAREQGISNHGSKRS
ncbi:hypothetical protein [Magnetospirillum sp. UT-4]|uniref:hypothetical protein n=1 Tax=Magnetospirillum sp. UT-4 TaxID=2681467 RepID=UPI0013848F0A|nr:hypothetical protein [Magnetospirillum sp. UT-4]CAA7625717.1 hypothetical protein MTBUT4_70087 [Magnetospirillum sp. UT-4]